ncbi:hypothetical protein L4G92_06655 [Neisseria sp. ZJ106]|uniref:Periplasmic protein n=1 Tax=Neisseria lisongii TaxID=2912188 RepID=A0AAW5AQL5_9NEIS|nr:hypothetical protein [Neisseria lisongii]MCF7521724.1 hypothetical protein [Neisseria lisongii]MCF7529703.1 hypothetical protein [Neisseria lisongii]WCL70834.1 hypothetical protein PJU73_05475 [Neisseria lisongii]
MTMKKLLALSAVAVGLGFGVSAYAKEINISANNTPYSADDAQKLAATALGMGVKEPVSLNHNGGSVTVSGSNATVCTFKVGSGAAPQIQGVSCK